MWRVFGWPIFWLTLQAGLLLLVFHLAGNLELRTDLPDCRDYIQRSEHSLLVILRGMRPLGYVYFLKAVHVFSPKYAALPVCQLLLYTLAVLAFYVALSRVLSSRWLALAAASTLLYGNTFLEHAPWVMAEVLGSALAIVVVALMLVLVRRPHSVATWVALTLGVFFAYQVHASFLFLVLLAPLLGLPLFALARDRSDYLRWRWRVTFGLLAACLVPLLVYCTLRWYLVGHFGLVPFAGTSLVGLAGQLLTEDLVPDLPERVRPLALRSLELEKEKRESGKSSLYGAWPTPPEREIYQTGVVPRLLLQLDQQEYEAVRWSALVWEVFHQAVMEELYDPDRHRHYEHESLTDGRLGELAWAIIQARPRAYLSGVWRGLGNGALVTLLNGYAFVALVILLVVLLAVWHGFYLWEQLRQVPIPQSAAPAARSYAHDLHILLLIAVGFALFRIALVALCAVPTFRYVDAAGLFLPTVPALAAFALGDCVRELVRRLARASGPAAG